MLWIIVKLFQVRCSLKQVWFTIHHFINLYFSYERLEVDVVVLDLLLVLL